MKLLSLVVYGSLKLYNWSSYLTRKIRLKNKVEQLNKKSGTKRLTKKQKLDIKTFYSNYGLLKVDTDWHRFYSGSSGDFSSKYLPENLFYLEIEPFFNKLDFSLSLSDKNLTKRLFSETKQPETILNNINGFFYSRNGLITLEEAEKICNIPEEMILKPTIETGGGKGVRLFTCHDNNTNQNNQSVYEFLKNGGKNYIIQKKIKQHSIMARLNETSLNTFRVMTLLFGNEVFILSSIVRMGRMGSLTDNSSGGGISCGVEKEGNLKRIGYEFSGASFNKTDSGIEFININLPFMDKVKNVVENLHKTLPYFKIVSWDLAIDDEEDVVLIEYNVKGQEINFHQLNNGPVLSKLLEVYNF